MPQDSFKVTRMGTYRGKLGRNLSFQVTLKDDREVGVEVVGNDHALRQMGGELVRVENTSPLPVHAEKANFSTRKVSLEIFVRGNYVISPGSFFGVNETRLWVTVAVGKRISTRKVVTIVLRYKNDPDPRIALLKVR